MKAPASFSCISRASCAVTVVAWLLAASPASAIVGYVNVPLPGGYSLVANPLDNTLPFGNTITNLFNGTIGDPFGAGGAVLKWTGSGYATFRFEGGDWTDGGGNPVSPLTLAVGEGAVVYNLGSQLTNTFVGEVRGLSLIADPVRLPVSSPAPGIYLRGSVAPIGGSGFADIMGRAPQNGDAVLKLDTAGNPLVSYFSDFDWVDPLGGNAAPTLQVGESAFFDTTGNQFVGFALPSTVVPEPATATLMGFGLMLAAGARRQNKRG